MIRINWKGKAVSKNKWHGVRNGRIYQTKEYKAFKESLAYTLRAQKVPQFESPSVMIAATLPARFDHMNLVDPVCDALELAGVVENDNDLADVHILKPDRHKRGEDSHIVLFIDGGMYA